MNISVKLSFCAALLGVALLGQNCGNVGFQSDRELASIHGPEIIDEEKIQPQSKARVGDRVFMASVFADIFLPQTGTSLSKAAAIGRAGADVAQIYDSVTSTFNTNDKALVGIIAANVLKQVKDFEGPCFTMEKDSTCANVRSNQQISDGAEVGTVASGSVSREGYRLSTCKLLIESGRAMSNLVLNATGSRTTELNEEQIMEIYGLFYPGQKISEEAYNSLVDLFADLKAKSSGETRLDVWRGMVTPICYSAGWQIP